MCLYGRQARRWTMTERGRAAQQRSAHEYRLGPSRLQWDGRSLVVDIDEMAVPLPRRVRGRVTVTPSALCRFVTALDAAGRHRWGPIGPVSRVEVEFDQPALRWQGHAYLDSNEGDEPIDTPFTEWDWSRATLADGSTAVIYDVRPKQGPDRVIAARFAPDGGVSRFVAPPRQPLPRTLWGIGRTMRSDDGSPPRVTETLEDTPFYARSVLASGLLGEAVTSVHETLVLPRLVSWPVQLMLPWRMPRRA